MYKSVALFLLAVCTLQCGPSKKTTHYTSDGFPEELVHFAPYKNNPVFAGTGGADWDKEIRERGYILREDSAWYSV